MNCSSQIPKDNLKVHEMEIHQNKSLNLIADQLHLFKNIGQVIN